MDPHSWGCTINLALENQVCNRRTTRLYSYRRRHDCCHLIKGNICGNRREGNGMLIQVSGICQCHVCRGRIENPYSKTIRNHSFRHKASARQRSLSRKGLRKKTTRHVEANCSNPKERPIHGGEKRIASFLGKEKENTKMEYYH